MVLCDRTTAQSVFCKHWNPVRDNFFVQAWVLADQIFLTFVKSEPDSAHFVHTLEQLLKIKLCLFKTVSILLLERTPFVSPGFPGIVFLGTVLSPRCT